MAMPEPSFAPDALRQLSTPGVACAARTSTLHALFFVRMAHATALRLRLGDLRVFYRVDDAGLVTITLIGVKKGNILLVEGEEFEL
jgi:hypothetical protein